MKADVVARFVDSVIANSDYTQMDKPYLYNRVLALVGEEGLKQEVETTDLIALKDELLTIAAKNGKVGETQNEYDNLGAELMNFIMPAPSVLNQRFWQTYETDKNKAIADFYALSKQNDYIKTKAIAKILPTVCQHNMVTSRSRSIYLNQKKILKRSQLLKR